MIIYKITNTINSKIYIGQTTRSLKSRWKGHCRSSENNKSNNLFHSAIAKYGKDSFLVEVIDIANSKDSLNELEKFYIEEYNSMSPSGYNLKTGGQLHVKYSEESKEKMSKAKEGTTVPEETKQKMSDAHKQRWVNEDNSELREKRSIQSKDMWKDIKYREKISLSRKEYWGNEDNRLVASDRAKKQIEEDSGLRVRISEGVKNAFNNEITKQKLIEHHKKIQKPVIDSNGRIYDSVKDAASALGVKSSNIVKVLKGDYKSSGGLTFKYLQKTKKEITNQQNESFINTPHNPLLPTIYIVSGISGAGKSWVCNQLKDKFNYISYDENNKKDHLDLLKSSPIDKITLYDLNIKTSTFIRNNHKDFNIHMVVILGDFLKVKEQLVSRGGSVTVGTYRRWNIMQKRAEEYGDFSGSSSEVLKYLKKLDIHATNP